MIKTPLLISLAAAALLTGNLQAVDTLDDQVDTIKPFMTLAAADTTASDDAVSDEEEEADDEADDEADEEEDEPDDDADDDEDEDEDDDEEMSDAEELEEQLTELNKRTSGNHLKFGVDFRTAVDNLQYKMADGSERENSALFTNRLWLNMNWAATENISFTGQLAYHKAYGARSGTGQIAGMEDFDWIVAESPTDGVVRVRSAYFFYRNNTFLGADIPWTFSIGRRPSTNGHLINLRDDDTSASPMGHSINVEFDGLSAKFTVWEDIGMYLKFCAGRGGTNASPRFFSTDFTGKVDPNGAPYSSNNDEVPNIDLGGMIFVPYDDGQYSIGMQYYYAKNLIDASIAAVDPTNPAAGVAVTGFETVGGLHSFTANFVMSGIGDEWSDFLDDTTFFVSGAVSITNPDDNGVDVNGYPVTTMLGSTDSERGYSWWVGLQFPSLITEEGRWGLEYNHGGQYWRSVTYGEDTLVGSKLAARGEAYEAYFTEPLIDDIFSFQLRFTYIDYKYTGSNGFFGSATGTPLVISELQSNPNPFVAGSAGSNVDTAQDIRAYLRYRF